MQHQRTGSSAKRAEKARIVASAAEMSTAEMEMIHGRSPMRRPSSPVNRKPAMGTSSTANNISCCSLVACTKCSASSAACPPPSAASALKIRSTCRYSFIDAYSSTSGVLRLR